MALPSGARNRMGNPWIRVQSEDQAALGRLSPRQRERLSALRPQNWWQFTVGAMDASESFGLAFFPKKILE